MNLIICGKAHINAGTTFREVADYLQKVIRDNGYGASDIGSSFPVLDDTGKRVAVASYNGRMWTAAHGEPGREEIELEAPTPDLPSPRPKRAPRRTYHGEEAEIVSAADQKVYDERLRQMQAGTYDFDSIMVARPSRGAIVDKQA